MCGLSTRKTRTPLPTQKRTTSRSACQSACQSSRVEVDVVDVLVALRRVLGVLERPVRAAVEPLRVLSKPRVVGRALDREVERDVDAELGGAGDEPLELLHRPELRVERVVAAVLAADRPGRAGVGRPRGERVVAALAVRVPDRVHRRQVEDVEAELGQVLELGLDAGEAAPRAREELVPGAEGRPLAVAVDPQLGRRGHLAAVVVGRRQHLLRGQRLAPEHLGLGELAREVVLPRRDLALELVPERGLPVDPGLDAVLPAAGAVRREGPDPAVGLDVPHRRLLPAALAGAAVAHGGADLLVAVAEDRRPDLDRVSLAPLDRVAAAVELRPDVLDLDPGGWFSRRGRGHEAVFWLPEASER